MSSFTNFATAEKSPRGVTIGAGAAAAAGDVGVVVVLASIGGRGAGAHDTSTARMSSPDPAAHDRETFTCSTVAEGRNRFVAENPGFSLGCLLAAAQAA